MNGELFTLAELALVVAFMFAAWGVCAVLGALVTLFVALVEWLRGRGKP